MYKWFLTLGNVNTCEHHLTNNLKLKQMKHLRSITVFIALLLSLQSFSQEKLAVIPFAFTDNGIISVQEGKEAQQFLIGYINKKHKHFRVSVINARDVNVAMHKAGITVETIDDFTTKEIAEAIGADYVLLGTIDKILQGSSSIKISSETTKTNNTDSNDTFGTTTSSTTNTYQATVYISIFKKDGSSIYDKSKGNIFIDYNADSWKNSIIWQVRHFPLYN